MGSHPINLAVRFLLELASLSALGYWGWTEHEGVSRWALVILLPIAAAAVWSVFAVPDDPSRSGAAPVPVPGAVRLLLELAIFATATVLLFRADRSTLGIMFAAIVVVHYAISYDRIAWLLSR